MIPFTLFKEREIFNIYLSFHRSVTRIIVLFFQYNEKEHKRKELELKEEYEDLNNRIKIRSMGNTRFVGELYMIQLLSANIMSGCIGQLVHSNSETELESLCKLIETIGEKYSTEDKCKYEVILYSLKV